MTKQLDTLAEAKRAEKEAQALRRAGRDTEAVAMYTHARELYAETDLALDDNPLADDVLRAIKRCDKTGYNIRHPQAVRPSAITPRPNCLCCHKPLPRFKFDGKTFADGTPREWGAYGDNRFCTLTCGWQWACEHSPMRGRAP